MIPGIVAWRRRGPLLGAELVTNGDFGQFGASWLETSWSFSSGIAYTRGAPSNNMDAALRQDLIPRYGGGGGVYRVSITVDSETGSNHILGLYGENSVSNYHGRVLIDTPGVHEFDVDATLNGDASGVTVVIIPADGSDMDVSNVSVRKYL